MQVFYSFGAVIAAATAVMAISPTSSTEQAPRPVAAEIAPATVAAKPAAKPAFPVADYVVPLNEAVAGHTQGFYANDWWQWAMSAPRGESPQDDPTGQACARDQGDKVWYLSNAISGKAQRRRCTVPAGRHLFFPVTSVYDTTAPARPLTCAEARRSAAHVADTPVVMEIRVDGTLVPLPEKHRIAPEKCFDLTARMAPEAGVAPMYPSATNGYWMMLRPLPPGRHVISFRVGTPDTKKPFAKPLQDVTYDLTILPTAPRG
ncbi:hypothetical protein [Sagittula sp. S175]|uniref:hypothetical protein n=1 Tax=Sagittula sp. S175 TaxID=3415129 RepID=UPI003C7EC8BA